MKQWLAFWSLGLIWGSSFLLIKIAVEELNVLPLVSIRITTAAIIMIAYLVVTKRRLPQSWPDRLGLVFVAFFNIALPFTLITRAEQTLDSSLATVLNSTVPLFSLIIAHFALTDEKLNQAKITGLVIGYVGVILLTLRGLSDAQNDSLAAPFMMIGAVISYAVAVVFMRARLRHLEPLTIAGTTLVLAALMIDVLVLLLGIALPSPASLQANTLFAITVLALVNTVVAYFIFYYLIDQWGARSTMVTYVFPPVGIALGAIFLGEAIDARLIFGSILIVAGVFVVNYRGRGRFLRLRPAAK
jgi:drug/metabolite transporter (DMT)-like permease